MNARRPLAKATPGTLGAFYARLRALGCTFCPACVAYLYPQHTCAPFASRRVYDAPAVVVHFTEELEAAS